MDRSKSQFSRLLELDRLIRTGKHPNCLTFSREWEVSQKTVQRDLDFLRDQMGAPVGYDREKKGFYYTDQNWFLPALSLSEGALFHLLVASRTAEQYRGTPVAKELDAIFRKLAELLPQGLSLRPELAFSKFSFTAPPAKPIEESVWVTLVRGLQHQRYVQIEYQAFGANKTVARVLAPYHIANLQGEWYVFGPAKGHDDIRQYSMARVSKASLADERFDVAPDFDPGKLLQHTFSRFTAGQAPQTVRLLFNKEVAPWILEREWHATQQTKRRKDGTVELSFKVAGMFEVSRWVLSWGHSVRILAPPELRDIVRHEVQQMAREATGDDL